MVVQTIFVVEILIRLAAHWPQVGRFFRDGWNVFDLAVVATSLLPQAGAFAMVARLARLLRVTRLVSAFLELRLIVSTMLRSIPSMGHILMMLGLLLYVYAVLGLYLFREHDPGRWATLGAALLTLFQMLTLEGWVEVQGAVIEKLPFAWLYFVSFVFVAVFVAAGAVASPSPCPLPGGERVRRSQMSVGRRGPSRHDLGVQERSPSLVYSVPTGVEGDTGGLFSAVAPRPSSETPARTFCRVLSIRDDSWSFA